LDYVVAGFGIGAILALIGFALWELYGNREEPGQGWLTRAAIGAMLGSLVIWAVTSVTLVSTLDDATASRVVMLTTLITIVAIVGGSIWYWRVDRALLASLPQQPAQKLRTQSAMSPVATAQPDAGIELSEWDSWPERGQKEPDTAEPDGAASEPATFEPEVAAMPESSAGVVVEPSTETVEEVAEAGVAEPEDVVVAVAVEAPVEEAVETDIDIPDRTATVEERPEAPTAEVEAEAPLVALPVRVEPFRHSRPAPASEPVRDEIAEAAGSAPAPPVDEKDREEESDGHPSSQPASKTNGALAIVDPIAFESSLLADIDATTAEGNGRYQSPLLADLEQDPDELEGVGLAKWRPEARLTAEDRTPASPPKSRRRR
jgi:hypothetical protein